jgi:hypothetical protein
VFWQCEAYSSSVVLGAGEGVFSVDIRWKEWLGGQGEYKHIQVRSILVVYLHGESPHVWRMWTLCHKCSEAPIMGEPLGVDVNNSGQLPALFPTKKHELMGVTAITPPCVPQQMNEIEALRIAGRRCADHS